MLNKKQTPRQKAYIVEKNTKVIQEWDREHKNLSLQSQTRRFLNCLAPK